MKSVTKISQPKTKLAVILPQARNSKGQLPENYWVRLGTTPKMQCPVIALVA
jgi:hypothetical protein